MRVLSSKGVGLAIEVEGGPQRLLINGKSCLALTQGQDIKGPYYGSNKLRSVFLPGDRYFLFNVNCGNFDGQLLIDTTTGRYERLPTGSVVYVTMNTDTYTSFRVTGAGIVID